MTEALAEWFTELRRPLNVPEFEPDIDDKDKEKDTQLREIDAVQSGLIRKRINQHGSGTRPADGDLVRGGRFPDDLQVYLHYSVATAAGQVLQSTRIEEGGAGLPLAFVIGKGRRVPRGWELAILDTRVGEVFQLAIHPKFGYGHPDCQLPPPRGLAAGEETHFVMQLLQLYPSGDVEVLADHGGMIKRILRRGGGVWESPRAPFQVTVGLRARLPAPDGSAGRTYFEAPSEQPLQFTMGVGAVPEAVEAALQSMCRGEAAAFTCAAASARGSAGSLVPPPPPSAETVELEVALISMMQVRDMTGDGKVMKRRLRDGRGEFPVDCPIEDSTVRVHFRVMEAESGRQLLDTRGDGGAAPPLEFQTGMAAVPEGLDMAVRLMTPGELASIHAHPPYAYGSRADRPQDLEEEAAVVWEVELLGFDRTAHHTNLSAEELLARGMQLKEQGNRVFRQGMNRHAVMKWEKALKILNQIFDLGDNPQQATAVDAAKASVCVNLALAAQRREDFSEALKWANKALQGDPDHAKALYRRASVHAFLNNHDEAEADFRRVAEIDSALKGEVDREVARMKARATSADRKHAKQWRGSIR